MAGPTSAQTAQRGAQQGATSGDGRPPAGRRPRGGLRRPGRRLVILVLALALLLTAGGIWLLYGSTWLRVEQVKVSGTQILTPDEVKSAAAVPIGAPLISVDTDAMAARLRQKLPRIDSVDVSRSWPHGIALKVTERQPVLLMKKAGEFTEVDAEGVRFATVERAPKSVPVLELTAGRSPSLLRFPVDRLIREAVQVAGELPAPVAKDTRTIRISSYDNVALELSGGRTVAWGSGEFGAAKARALIALMKAVPRAVHFDVSAPTAPAASGS
ncbi:FtsQ-type POTRA domain-containing protein [Streptomyces sp. NPDC050738]|uniref:cell division protein FtsQ/DivIB n=1 Tax=Streptomyces sp. NPDC050738 TaxID=3154744 RepID=UPI003433A3C8